MNSSQIPVIWHRAYDDQRYALMLCIGTQHGHAAGGLVGTSFIFARAVMDDYGTLVIVREWM